MDNTEVAPLLAKIADLLESGREEALAVSVRNALSGSDQALQEFLRSNELWGGAGSISDQACVGRSEQRKELERLLIQLGRIQLRHGNTNARTKTWVEAFEKWSHLGT